MADEDRLRELLAKVEAGDRPPPWECDGSGVFTDAPPDEDVWVFDAQSEAEAALIVEAVNSLPDLLSELAQLREENRRLSKQVMALVGACTGAHDCPSMVHIHGCYGEDEHSACDDPDEHAALSRYPQEAPKEDEDG